MPEPTTQSDQIYTATGQSKLAETRVGSSSPSITLRTTFGPPAEPDEVGTLGPYRVVKELGKGGMGAVYLALDTRLKRQIALKIMLPQYAADAAAKERFLREAQAAAQITHDNVVTVYEADERDGVPYIAMQFLEGYPLNEYLRRWPRFAVPQILHVARETAMGLAAAHKIGLIHRDIKPANLWLEAPGGRVKVLDFGLAKPVHTENELTQTGEVVGTPAYMSPEQGRGLKLDHRTDLFSLGAVLYRLCTGELPFQGPTTMAVLMALGSDDPTSVRECNPEIPDSLAQLVHQLLAKKPDERPQTADEVAWRARAIAEELTARATSTPMPQVVALSVPVAVQSEHNAFANLDATETEPDPESSVSVARLAEPVRKKAGGKTMWIAAGLAVLLAVVAVAVVAVGLKNGRETKTDAPDASAAKDTKPGTPPAPVVKPPTADPSPNRKAAEYVLSLGGTVQVNGDSRDLRTPAELPAGGFTLTGFSLAGNMALTDAELGVFKGCKHLAVLQLGATPVSDAGLVHFKDCSRLTNLSLYGTRVSDAGVGHFKDFKELAQLNLGGTQVTDAGLINFKDREGLTHLHLGSTQVGDPGLINFRNCKRLEHLDLNYTKATDVGLAHFKECKGLLELHLKGTQVTAKGRDEFHAAVPGCRITHDGGTVEPKSDDPDRAAALYVLSVGGELQVNGDARTITTADKLPPNRFTLTLVSLGDNAKVTDAGLVKFRECKGITALDLAGTQVTDAGLEHFKDCKDLIRLDLGDTIVGDAGLEYFKGCASLTHLDLSNTEATDEGLAHFKDCKNLTHLYLHDTEVGKAGLAHFKDCTELLELYLSGTRVTDAGLANFKDCKKLTHLDLGDTRATDVGLAHFKDCKNLTRLDLSGTRVTDAGLALFKNCKALALVSLYDTELTDAGLAHLKDCTELLELALSGTQITDAGLAHLNGCQKLRQLDLKGTKATAKGAAEFHATRPGCRIDHNGGTLGPKK
jgi:eukaryotic-like serine/threonine-protein kinase